MAAKAGAAQCTLYVRNLCWTTGDKQLKQYFAQFGYISRAQVIFDRNTGMSKGFGFVTFLDKASVEAVNKVQSHNLDGLDIVVQVTEKFN